MGYVQGAVNDTGSTLSSTCAITLTGVAAGNTLILVILSGGSGTTVSSVSDGVNTWARVVNRVFVSGGGGSEIWAAYNVAAGSTTVTSTISSGSVNHKVLIHEVSGILTASGFDVGTGQAQATTTAPSSTSTATTAQASEYIFGFLAQGSGSATITEDTNGFTLRHDAVGASTTQALHSADKVVSATGAYAYAPTLSALKATVTLIATFKLTSGTSLTPGKASLTTTKYAPALNLSVPVPKATLSLTAQPAALKFTLPVAKATLSLTGQVPALKFTLPIPKASVSLIGQAPALKLTLPIAKASLSITGKTPTAAISADRTAQPGTASLLLTGRVPTVTATANVWLTPATKALHLTASLPLAVVTLPGGDPLRNIYRVDQSGLGGDIYKGAGSQTRSGNGNILRSDPSVLTWDEIPGNWDDIAGTFDGTSSSRPRLFKR